MIVRENRAYVNAYAFTAPCRDKASIETNLSDSTIVRFASRGTCRNRETRVQQLVTVDVVQQSDRKVSTTFTACHGRARHRAIADSNYSRVATLNKILFALVASVCLTDWQNCSFTYRGAFPNSRPRYIRYAIANLAGICKISTCPAHVRSIAHVMSLIRFCFGLPWSVSNSARWDRSYRCPESGLWKSDGKVLAVRSVASNPQAD